MLKQICKLIGRGQRTPIAGEFFGATVVIALGSVVAALAAPYNAQSWSVWIIYGLLALSFTFVWGHGGIFSLGQAAFFGLGGYAYGVFGINVFPTTNESLSALVVAAIAGTVAAALLGYFIFFGNIGDVYLAVITIATTLVLLTFFASTADPIYHIGDALLGGYNGMVGIPPLVLPGGTFLEPNGVLLAVIVVAAAVGFGLHFLLRRPFGRILAGVRENELRSTLLGYDVRRYKLLAFMIGGAIAGLAGGLYASWGSFINPQVFTLQQATLVAIWTLVGGRKSLLGAFVGAVIVQGMADFLGAYASGAIIPVVLGSLLIAVVLFLPEGVVPSVSAAVRRIFSARMHASLPPNRREIAPDIRRAFGRAPAPASRITALDLHKQFGGLHALRGASLDISPNAVHCLIGPNGAGKSTFFNLLAGRYIPTSGNIHLNGTEISRRRPDERARLGLGIKLQVPSIYLDLPVSENVWLAAYGASHDAKLADQKSHQVVSGLQLDSKSAHPASELSHGEHQWLEIGMVISREPSLVLLDEPAAGMSRFETERFVDLIRVLSESATVLVVEHDMDFVRDLNVQVTMFHEGKVFAEGTIDELRADERVLDIYLGRPRQDA